MKVLSKKNAKKKYDAVVVAVDGSKSLKADAKALDKKMNGAMSHGIKTDGSFEGKYGQVLSIILPKGNGYNKAVILGLGDKKELCTNKHRALGGKLNAALNGQKISDALVLCDHKEIDVEAWAEGLLRKHYSFLKHKSDQKKANNKTVKSVAFDSDGKADIKNIEALLSGIQLTKDLVSSPPNFLYPDSFAKIVQKELKPLGVKVTVLDDKKLEKMGAGAITAVGKGSSRKPRMVIMEYNGVGKSSKKPKTALVGKGITFDTGGYNVKTSSMEWMLFDMGGAGAVTGAMKALAAQKAKCHVVAVLALAENMIANDAYRPSDILTTLSGQTVEVLNTDAEGRLVMCDAMTYVQNEYKPEYMFDMATLTGACIAALGWEYAGVFTDKDELWPDIEKAGKESGEKIWRMPLDDVWNEGLKSSAADFTNLDMSRYAGASTAGLFLKKFVQEGVKWAHFDIAGTAWSMKPKDLWDKGATGYGVSILSELTKSLQNKK